MASAPGIYQVWSSSVLLPGKYVFGLFAIYEDCRTIKTLEIQRLPAIRNDESGIIIQPSLEEISSGYMIKKSQQIMIHGFDLITHLFKFTSIIDTLRGTDDRGYFNVMKGIDIQIIGQNHFSRPKVFIRQNNIEDLLNVPPNLEQPSDSPFPNFSAKDKEIFNAIKHLDVYSTLSLLEEDCVPDFIKAQLASIGI
jgi:hypothetical protein